MKKFLYDVFLSHNSDDKDIARRVATKLRDAGLNVWFDEWVIAVGDDIFLTIEYGLEQSRALILFISSKALKSRWVDLERSTALFRDPTNKARRFIPIVIDQCKIPDTLRRYRYLDFRQDQDQDKRILELIELCHGSTSQSRLKHDEGALAEYRKAHILRYSALIEGRHPIKVKAVGRSGSLVDASTELESWVESPRSTRLAVLGDPGSGKTYLLRQLCSTLSGRDQCTPVFINAGLLRNLRPISREELVAFADPPLPYTAILDVGNVIVIIDGLDELIGPTSREQVKYSDTLDAVGRLIPKSTRLIVSCRSTTFEVINSAVSKALGVREQARQSSDATDDAIRRALSSKGNPTLEQLALTELTKEQAHTYLEETVGGDGAANQAAAYVLEHLPRVPVILRFLQLALPELQCLTGRIDLDELYSAALRAWILRDPVFADQDIDGIWDELRTNSAFDSVQISDTSVLARLVHSGLLSRTPNGGHIWSHFSINEFFFANFLFEEIKAFNADILARIDLIRVYNVNRFVVPMCRRELMAPPCTGGVRPVIGSMYSAFLEETGWRRNSGYGRHPSYIAKDGTGFISGIDDLKPELYAQPKMERSERPICGVSWYDAFVYCLWSGESLPDSRQLQYGSLLSPGLWYWGIDWSDERKAHVTLVTPGLDGGVLRKGGANPDFRHSRIALATVRDNQETSFASW